MGRGAQPAGLAAMSGGVTVQRDGHVALVEFANPPNNFIGVPLAEALNAEMAALDADKEIRAIVLASAGKVFCAGADLAGGDIPVGQRPTVDGRDPFYVEAARLFAVKTPIVGAIQGAAIGAGLGLALVPDFRIAAPEARFAANFVKLGFHPGFGITHTLPRLVGQQRAALMCLTGRRIKAEEALAWGLVDEIVPLDRLRDTAIALAREIAEAAPLAVQATRATMRGELSAAVVKQTDHELAEQTWLRQTADFAEGVRAVNERRPGKFTGA